MKTKSSVFGFAALLAAVVSAAVLESGTAQTSPPDAPGYQTACQAVDETTVEGFVTNPGTSMIRIDGLVRFTFTLANSMSRPTLQVPSSATIPPGRTVSVARAKLIWSLRPGEVCQLDLTGAVR
ncbi:MAG: hypothetical protein HYV14_14030 [Elusimicrobia bacterium]|nr:hypothetical protein [Elusimicrobiota bacterium]